MYTNRSVCTFSYSPYQYEKEREREFDFLFVCPFSLERDWWTQFSTPPEYRVSCLCPMSTVLLSVLFSIDKLSKSVRDFFIQERLRELYLISLLCLLSTWFQKIELESISRCIPTNVHSLLSFPTNAVENSLTFTFIFSSPFSLSIPFCVSSLLTRDVYVITSGGEK